MSHKSICVYVCIQGESICVYVCIQDESQFPVRWPDYGTKIPKQVAIKIKKASNYIYCFVFDSNYKQFVYLANY